MTHRFTDAQWKRLQELYTAASVLDEPLRDEFLRRECAGDAALEQRVRGLLNPEGMTATSPVGAGLRSAAAAELGPIAGDRIGPWEVVRQLGRGGMGTVVLAVRADDQYRRQVAIKLIHAPLAGPEMLARFRSERQILANLDHPNIARLLDGGATPQGMPYVVMEYVDGRTIDVYCVEHRLPVRARLELFRQLCDAVTCAHRNLVVHRDIKPANVLVTKEGTAKLLDFGIAKLLSEDDGTPRTVVLTQVHERLMTPDYASPEQVMGQAITTATDTYSLGVLLYELLTGKRPFQLAMTSAVEMQRLVCDTEPPRPSLRAAGIDPDLDNIVLMAMRKEASRRYGSVEQFSDDIRRYLEGFPVLAREDSWRYRAGKFVRRHRLAVGAAVALAVIIVGFAAGMALLARRVSAERDIALTERRKAEQVSQFLIDSFRVADRSGQKGRTVTAQEVLDRGSERIFRQLTDQPSVRAKMMNTMGEVYESLGLYDRAQALLTNALAVRRKTGAGADVAESLSSLGELVETRGDYAAAEAYYRNALATQRRIAGDDSAAVAEMRARLGTVLGLRAQVADAERLLQASLAARKKLFGPKSAPVADSLARLGRFRGSQEKFAEAEPYFREALAIRRTAPGADDPDTAASINDLASLLNTLGKGSEAEALDEEALALHRRLYGDSHILVGEDLATLAVLRFNAGDYPGAITLNRQAIEIFRKALGPESPQLADAMTELSNALLRMGVLPEAEAQIRAALAMYSKMLGEHHPSTANAVHNLINVLHDKGDFAQAEKLSRELVAWQRKTDATSPALAFNLAGLGGLQRAAGDFRGADESFREARPLFLRAFGEKHPMYGRALASLGQNRIALGDLKGAEELLGQSLAILRQAAKRSPLDLSYPLVGLAETYLKQGRAAEAEKAAREAVELRRATVVANDARLAIAESLLGGALAALKRNDEALELLERSHRNLLKLRAEKSLQGELRRLEDFKRGR